MITPTDGAESIFELEIPDYDSKQTADRLPLPAHLIGADTATAVFAAVVDKFIDRNGQRLEKLSPFPYTPLRVGRDAVWARFVNG